MKGWGIFFLVSGIAAFFLPQMFGIQLLTVSIFGEHWVWGAIAHIVLGAGLIAGGYFRNLSSPGANSE